MTDAAMTVIRVDCYAFMPGVKIQLWELTGHGALLRSD